METPWQWRPSRTAWFEILRQSVAGWEPVESLGLDRRSIAKCIDDAASMQHGWLWHPCTSRLTNFMEGDVLQRDVQLAIWASIHGLMDLGWVTLPQALTVWVPDCGKVVERGEHSLRDLAMPSGIACPTDIAIDVWCDSLGYAETHSWAARPPLDTLENKRLDLELFRYVRTVTFAKTMLTNCYSWIADMTQMTIPLRGDTEGFRSRSHPGRPGTIELDLLAENEILESLVHESAHMYMYLAEMTSALISPEHEGRYPSPLRPEPRPLRGILLAYHALAYICAFYRDTLDIPMLCHWGERELILRQMSAREAESVLLAQSSHLTVAGRDFFERTRSVLEYAIH